MLGALKNLWVYLRVLMADMCFSAGATVVPPGLMTQPLTSQRASGCRFPVSRVWLCVCLNTHPATRAESGILTRWRVVTSSQRRRTSTKPTWRRCKWCLKSGVNTCFHPPTSSPTVFTQSVSCPRRCSYSLCLNPRAQFVWNTPPPTPKCQSLLIKIWQCVTVMSHRWFICGYY